MSFKLSNFKVSNEEKHPVIAGLLALAGVAVVFGLAAGVIAIAASFAFGGGGDKNTSATPGNTGSSLYLPSPKPTKTATGPLITLAPAPSESAAASAKPTATPTPTATKKPKEEAIALSTGQAQVSSMGRIDLLGVYPEGEGAVLQVQRKEAGKWVDFPVTVGVSGGQFSTYVETGRAGKQKWRVRDTESGKTSNAVAVTVG